VFNLSFVIDISL